MVCFCAALLAGLLLAPAVAQDDPEIPTNRVTVESLTAVRVNPLGLQEYATLSYRRRLMDSDSILFSDTYVSAGPTVALSPAFAKVGAQVKVVPIALLELSATYRYQVFFGTFEHIIGFESTDADWSDTALVERTDEAEAMGGHELTLSGRLQARVSIVAVRETVRLEYNDLPLAAGDIGYYDQTPDMLMPNAGWLMVSDLDLILLPPPEKLKPGIRWTYTAPFYGEGDKSEGNDSHRVGPLVAYTFFERPGARFNNPTLLVLAQWHLQHRFRTGEDVSQALPYLALAFLWEGDLLPW